MESLIKKYTILSRLIEENERFVLTSHIHTDGDAIGSLTAMFHYLSDLGKTVEILLPGEAPPRYAYLDTNRIINQITGQKRSEFIKNAQVVIMLDISAISRLGCLLTDIKESKALKICIDHHPFEKEDWIDFQIVHTNRVATGEMIYQFFKSGGISISLEMAKALYTAILSDSGSFRFQKTDSYTFGMAAELVKLGVDPSEMYGYVYENGTKKQLKAWGEILSGIESRGNIAWLTVKKAILDSYNLSLEEMEGIIDILRKNREALIVMVFIEKSDREILVGLRSKNGFDVGNLAQRFGGGGHFHAAGFTGYKPLAEVIESTITMIETINSNKVNK